MAVSYTSRINETVLNEAVRSALGKLSEEQQAEIMELADKLVDKVREINPHIHFSTNGALMVLAGCDLAISRKRFGDVLKE